MNSVSLQVGQKTTASVVPLQADGVTPTPGAVVSKQAWVLADPSLTATANPDGTLTIEGAAASAGPVSGSVSATVTDPDGAVDTYSQSFTVTVTAPPPPPPPPQTTSIGVAFTTPA